MSDSTVTYVSLLSATVKVKSAYIMIFSSGYSTKPSILLGMSQEELGVSKIKCMYIFVT